MTSRPWTRAERFAFGVLVAGMLASLAFFVHGWFDCRGDAAIYILTAKSLLAGTGYTYLGEPLIVRPPGMSFLIAPVIALRGVDFGALNLYTSLWGVAAVALLFVWSRPRLGWPVAFALCAYVWLNRGWQLLCNQTMSDLPGAALLLTGLLLERWAASRPSWKRDSVLGAVIALSAYVRTMNLLLVPAILISRAFELRREALQPRTWLRAFAPLVLATVVVQVPWTLYTHSHRPSVPDERVGIYDYSTGMWRLDPTDPTSERLSTAAIVARAPTHLQDLFSVLGRRMRLENRSLGPIALGAAFAAIALFQLLPRNRPEGWLLFLTIAVLAFYYNFDTRLALPVWLLGSFAVTEFALDIARRWLRPARAQATVVLALVVVAGHDFVPHAAWAEIERAHRIRLEVASRLNALVPAEQRLAVVTAGSMFSIYLDRPVWTLSHAWHHAREKSVEKLLREQRIDVIALYPWGRKPLAIDTDADLRRWIETGFDDVLISGDLRLARL